MLKLVSLLKLTNYRTKDLWIPSKSCTVRKLQKILPFIPACICKVRSRKLIGVHVKDWKQTKNYGQEFYVEFWKGKSTKCREMRQTCRLQRGISYLFENCILEENKCPKLNMNSFYLSNVVEKRKNCMQWCTQVFNFWSKAHRSEKASAKTTLRTKCSQSQ